MAGKKEVVRDVLEIAAEFVIKRKGTWEHAEWEAFLKKAGKAGAPEGEAGEKILGAILESAKGLYHALDEPAPPKAAKAKKAAAAKPSRKKAAADKPA